MPYKIKLNKDTAELITNVAAIGANDEYQDYGIYELMTGNDTFTMDNFYYQGENDREGEPQKFINAETTFNGGTWGKQLTTSYYGPDQGSQPIMLPFADRHTMPHPYVDYDTTQKCFLREFPATITSDHNSSYCRYRRIPLVGRGYDTTGQNKGLFISYDTDTQYLTVTRHDLTKPLLQTKASPYIVIDIQGEGGKGGAGAYFEHSNIAGKQMAVAGGGGGGSGGFTSISANLLLGEISVYHLDNCLSIEGPGDGTGANRNRLVVSHGRNGTNGTALDRDTGLARDPKGTGGTGGAGGEVTIVNSNGEVQFRGESCRNKTVNTFYVIDAIDGKAGANGSGTEALGSYSGRTNQTVAGGAPRRQTYLTSVNASSVQVVKEGTDDQTFGGNGEFWDDTKSPAFAGGGGGAASIMADGGDWADHERDGNTIGIGAGGHGQSGWTGMTPTSGGGGGDAALWIAYILL